MDSFREPILSVHPAGDRSIRAVILIGGALITAGCVVLSFVTADPLTGIWGTGLALLGSLLLIWVILPRRYELWPGKLSIVFTLGWAWNIPYETISTVRPAKLWEAFAFFGVRFATSPGRAIVVMRKAPGMFRRPNIVISPQNRDRFLAEISAKLR
jgi:hypothetical protein